MVNWNEEHQCLCDYMGLPISRTAAKELLAEIRAHLKHSAPDLAHAANKIMQKRYPSQPPLPVETFQ